MRGERGRFRDQWYTIEGGISGFLGVGEWKIERQDGPDGDFQPFGVQIQLHMMKHGVAISRPPAPGAKGPSRGCGIPGAGYFPQIDLDRVEILG